ncbi:hypothetical protein ACFRAU_07230 [Arthrobacter sp. NPDC056691]|uniref:hypothetical protein n=1 Tax=Arthrobacter sp. NPDC056691 TaxID=3345913 RepID=UPI0036701DB7
MEHHGLAIHTLLWHEFEPRFKAVRDVLRQKELLYIPVAPVPESLVWATIGYFSASRFTTEGGRWFVTKFDTQTRQYGRRVEIPTEFIGASTTACRELARRIIAEDGPGRQGSLRPTTNGCHAATSSPIEQAAWNLHVMLWQELKERIRAVFDVLYRKEMGYPAAAAVPAELRWARLSFSTAWFSSEGERRFMTPFNSMNGEFTGPRIEIPPAFVRASPLECRRPARRIIAEHFEAEKTAEIHRLRQELARLGAA